MINSEPLGEAIKVIAGNPSPGELATLLAVLEAAHGERVSQGKRIATTPASSWNRNTSIFRHDLSTGFGQWQAQYRPGLD